MVSYWFVILINIFQKKDDGHDSIPVVDWTVIADVKWHAEYVNDAQ